MKRIPANVLSVDVEDYFQVEAFASRVAFRDWDSFESRVERNVRRVLELFDRGGARGTFFVLGWVAMRFPALVREIAACGHEIGCHGFAHQRLNRLDREEFRADLRQAGQALSDILGRPVLCYRAPSFSIVKGTLWALEVLSEEGFRFDSSVFPIHHDLYGIPDADRFPYWHRTGQGSAVFEFPPSTIRFRGVNVGVGGGGYLRFPPYGLTRRALRHINTKENMPAMVYFHPWEIDPDQPRIEGPLRSRVRHYTNLRSMERKIERLLEDFRFEPLTEVCERLEAYQAETVTASMRA